MDVLKGPQYATKKFPTSRLEINAGFSQADPPHPFSAKLSSKRSVNKIRAHPPSANRYYRDDYFNKRWRDKRWLAKIITYNFAVMLNRNMIFRAPKNTQNTMTCKAFF